MKPKNYKTKPFRYTYRVYDKYDGVCIFKTTDLIEAYGVLHDHRHETVVISQFSYEFYLYESGHPMRAWEATVPRYQLWDHFGNEVPYSKYRDAYEKRYPRYRRRGSGNNYWNGYGGTKKDTTIVRFKKNDPNKIKKGYYHSFTYDNWSHADYDDFIVGGCYRAIRSTNERRQTSAHVADYGAEIVRGRRRGRNLPNAWDDESRNISWDTAQNWKHNSRRRHQWKIKT